MQLSFTTNFKDTEVMLQRMEAGLPVKQRELLDALTPRFIAIQQESLRAVTPQNTRGTDPLSTFPEGNPPRLEDTTRSDVIRTGSNQYQSVALIQTYQTKMVPVRGQDDAELSNILVEGRTTPPMVPVNKQGLYWPNMKNGQHPIGFTKNPSTAAPNDYFQRARDDAFPKIEAAAEAGVASMAESIFSLT